MKANELMQGDIVLYEYDGQKFPARVIEIYRNSVLVESINGEYEPIEIEEDKIFPVDLIPEILEKNGFILKEEEVLMCGVKIAPYYTRDDLPFEVFCDGDPFAIWFNNPVNIKYIHQLQHCLKLVGIEKEIAL